MKAPFGERKGSQVVCCESRSLNRAKGVESVFEGAKAVPSSLGAIENASGVAQDRLGGCRLLGVQPGLLHAIEMQIADIHLDAHVFSKGRNKLEFLACPIQSLCSFVWFKN